MSSAAPSLSSEKAPDQKAPDVEFITRVQGFACDLGVYRIYFDPTAKFVPTKLTREALEKRAAAQKKTLPADFDFEGMISAGPRAYQLLIACREHVNGPKEKPAKVETAVEAKAAVEGEAASAEKAHVKKNPHGLMTDERLEIVLKAFPEWKWLLHPDPEREFRIRVESLAAYTRKYQLLFDPKAKHIPARLTVDRLKKRAAKSKVAVSEEFDFDAIIKAGDRTCELAIGYQKDLKPTEAEEGKRDPLREARKQIVEEHFLHWKGLYGKTAGEQFKEKVDLLTTRLATYRQYFDPEADIISYGMTPDVLRKKATKAGMMLPMDFKLEGIIESGTEMADILRACRAINAGDKRRTAGVTPTMAAYAYEKLPGIEIRARESASSAAAGNDGARNQQAHFFRSMDFTADKLEARPRMVCAVPQRIL